MGKEIDLKEQLCGDWVSWLPPEMSRKEPTNRQSLSFPPMNRCSLVREVVDFGTRELAQEHSHVHMAQHDKAPCHLSPGSRTWAWSHTDPNKEEERRGSLLNNHII